MKTIPCWKCNDGGKTSNVCKCYEGSKSALIDGLSAAIGVFERRMDDYDAWYYKQDRVSLAIMAERESLVDKCQWAIGELKKAQGR